MSTNASANAPRDHVPWGERIGLGLGKIVADGSHGTLHVLVNPIYNMTLGLNPALISTVVFIQRIWDAMLDPVWGNFSDNFRSKWGRRRPLMLLASVPLALFFAAIWWFPLGAGQSHLFWHLLLVSLVFYAAHSLYAMPLAGLTIEATDDYHERTRLAAITLAFAFAVQIGSQWLFPFTRSSFFSDPITGLRWVVLGCAAVFVAFGLAPVFLCREHHYARLARNNAGGSLFQNLKAVRGNRSFIALLGARCVASFGYNLVGMLGMYMNTYYVFGGDIKSAALVYGTLGSSFHATALLLSLFVYPRVAKRLGKRRTLQVAVGILILGCSAKLVAYQPGQPWLQLVVLCCNGAAHAGLWLIPTAMLGDIADEDELKTGLRREALFASLLYWFEKAGNSLGSLLGGFVLLWIGFDAKIGGQTAHTLLLMKYSYVLAPALGAVVALLFIRRYSLTEADAYRTKAELARRHEAESALPAASVA